MGHGLELGDGKAVGMGWQDKDIRLRIPVGHLRAGGRSVKSDRFGKGIRKGTVRTHDVDVPQGRIKITGRSDQVMDALTDEGLSEKQQPEWSMFEGLRWNRWC